MRIRIGVPCYDGKLFAQTTAALMAEMIAMAQRGWAMEVGSVPGSSLVHLARDRVAHEFMVGNCDRLVMIDSDVSWEPGSICKLIDHTINHPGVDMVGGAYPYKKTPEGYPVTFHAGETKSDPKTGLVSVSVLPGGFMCLTRNVFDTMRKRFKQRKTYKLEVPNDIERNYETEVFPYFHCPPGGGEDGTFCQEWQKCGGKTWLDADLNLAHHDGVKTYMGNLLRWSERTNCGHLK